MPLLKSKKAKQELALKQRVLSVRERSTLFSADGIKTRDEPVEQELIQTHGPEPADNSLLRLKRF